MVKFIYKGDYIMHRWILAFVVTFLVSFIGLLFSNYLTIAFPIILAICTMGSFIIDAIYSNKK